MRAAVPNGEWSLIAWLIVGFKIEVKQSGQWDLRCSHKMSLLFKGFGLGLNKYGIDESVVINYIKFCHKLFRT